jgi:hypothetical protein
VLSKDAKLCLVADPLHMLSRITFPERKPTLSRRNASRVRTSLFTIVAIVAGILALTAPLAAQNYPTKPVRIIAGAAPGGLIDVFARTFAQNLQARTGQPALVENSVATGRLRSLAGARLAHLAMRLNVSWSFVRLSNSAISPDL